MGLPSTGPLLVSDAASRTTAEAYVLSTAGGPGSCIREGLLAALDLLQTSQASDKVLIHYGDGDIACAGAGDEAQAIQRALDDVTGRNAGQVAIHTVAVMSEAKWLQELASRNGGTFHQIVR